MQGLSVLAKSLRDQRWQVAGFGLALGLMSLTAVLLWPSVRDTLQNFELPAAAKALLGTNLSIATAAGYLSARYFSWVDVLLIVYVVIQGTGAIAGEESNGTMDLLLAQPISRRSILMQKAAAAVAGSVAIIAMGWVGFALSVPWVSIDVSVADTAVACANMLPLTLLFYALSLWAGTVAPSRAAASGLAIAFATVTYFISTLATGVEALRNLQYATPFYYYGSGRPLVDGINWPHVALLLGVSAGFLGLALRSFERRDVSTGGASDVDFVGSIRRTVLRQTPG